MGRPPCIHNEETCVSLQPISPQCHMCGHTAHVAYHTQRRVTTLHDRFCFGK
jgi:hypothetical protein